MGRSTFTDQLRRAIEQSGKTHYRICQETGIDKASLSKLMSGQRGISIAALDRLFDYLGLSINAPRPTKGK